MPVTITATKAFHMDSILLGPIFAGNRTFAPGAIDFNAGAWSSHLVGSFKMTPTGAITGTINSFEVFGQTHLLALTVSGLNVDLTQFKTLVKTSTTAAVFSSLLAHGGTITGSGDSDYLIGYGGSDTLSGGAGNDTLKGGAGADVLNGGLDADTLIVGTGRDILLYNALADSTVGSHDLIVGFTHGLDRIDLAPIDANTHAAGLQHFHLGATASHLGDIVVAYDAGHNQTVVTLYNSGHATPDGEILLSGHLTLSASDFILS